MESTMPAKATASAVFRAGPFMFVSFSFRSRLSFARLEFLGNWPRAGGSETRMEKLYSRCRPNELLNHIRTGSANPPAVGAFQSPQLQAASLNSWCHQPDAILKSHMADSDRLHNFPFTKNCARTTVYWPAMIFGVINPT